MWSHLEMLGYFYDGLNLTPVKADIGTEGVLEAIYCWQQYSLHLVMSAFTSQAGPSRFK